MCHYGGPRFIVRVIPVANLNAGQLKEYLLEVITMVERSGCRPVSSVCDNCPLNQRIYKDLGVPGLVQVPIHTLQMYLVYDYVHIFINIRNEWITEPPSSPIYGFQPVSSAPLVHEWAPENTPTPLVLRGLYKAFIYLLIITYLLSKQ